MHTILKEVSASPKWAKKITETRHFHLLSEAAYFDILCDAASGFRMWETTYYHVLRGYEGVVEWYKGTAMRPYLDQLSFADQSLFEADVLAEVQKRFAVQKDGSVLFPFPRLFFVAYK